MRRVTKQWFNRAEVWATRNPALATLGAWVVLVLARLPYWWWLFPSPITSDNYYQISQVIGRIPWWDHHPVGSTLAMGATIAPLYPLIGLAGAIAITSLLQVAVTSAIVAYALRRMFTWGLRLPVLLSVLGLYALFPPFSEAVVTVYKDTQFGFAFLLWIVLLIDLTRAPAACLGNWRWVAAFMLTMAAVALFRHNGSYVTFATAIVLLIVYRAHWRRVLVAVLVPLLVATVGMRIVNNVLGTAPGSVVEALSVPLQQIGRTARDHPTSFTGPQLGFIAELFDGRTPAEVGQVYYPNSSDPLKGFPGNPGIITPGVVDGNLLWFARGWLDLGLSHPGTYLAAFAENYYRYFIPHRQQAFLPMVLRTFDDATMLPFLGDRTFTPTPLGTLLTPMVRLYRVPVLGLPWAAAVWTWLCIVAFIALIRARRHRLALVVGVPILVLFLTILAGPLNGSFRYLLPIILTTPILYPLATFNPRPTRTS